MRKKKKFLVIFTGDLPTKFLGASTVVFYQFIKFILGKDYELHLLAISTSKYKKKNIIKFLNSFKNKKIKSFNYCFLKNFFNFNKFNLLIKKIKTSSLSKSQISKIKKIKPDKILALDITATSFAKQIFDDKIYVWLGDLNFSTTWYHFYYKYFNSLAYYIFFLYIKIFVLKWKHFYKNILSNTNIISGSNANIKELKKIGIHSEYQPYPWPKVFKKQKIKKRNKPSYVFFGNLVGLGSKSAFNYLLNEIYPKYELLWGQDGFNIFVCGSHKIGMNYKKKIKKLKNIHFLGYVKNLNRLVSTCHACLFPIDVPVGNRSRIVTGLGSGWPIIAHKNVSIGNPHLKNGYNCLLAENSDDFVKISKQIYKNHNLSKNISFNAIKTYNRTHEPKHSLQKFEKFLND